MPILTNHSKKRARQRSGVTKNNLDTMAGRAYREGIRHSNAIGELRTWMDAEYLKYNSANNCRLYANKLYIFHNDILITIINAPLYYEQELEKYVKSYKTYINYRRNRLKYKSNVDLRNEFINEIKPIVFSKINNFIADLGETEDFSVMNLSNTYLVTVLFRRKDQAVLNKIEHFIDQEFNFSCEFRRNKNKKGV